MSNTPSNNAAWLVALGAKPLEVKPAPYTHPSRDQIVVKVSAIAFNPADAAMQETVRFPIPYPFILGMDLAGTVVDVGDSVTGFKSGDRVLGCARGVTTQKASESAFQEYIVLEPNMVSKIPDDLPFERAAVLPLAVATAAAGLYQKGYLELAYPQVTEANPTQQTLLIWGGASSVGCNAIQLAVTSGYEVFATASAKNFELVKRLGASQVFDYTSQNVTEEIIEALGGRRIAGAFDAITDGGAFEACVEIVRRSNGNRFVAFVKPGPHQQKELPQGVKSKWLLATDIAHNEVSKAIFNGFLPHALAEGRYTAAPKPDVVGRGLECVQRGMDAIAKGVSASKIVVTL